MVEHLKVMAALSVEPAYASLTVEPAYAFNLLIGWGGLMVEHLKVLMVEREIPADSTCCLTKVGLLLSRSLHPCR